LKNKIQFKASSKVSNDAVLFKAFKFFDLYNNGWLSKSDFFKAIAKCGVVPETHVLNILMKESE
jgi:Ca2+-binding EF-hand superfamily protein